MAGKELSPGSSLGIANAVISRTVKTRHRVGGFGIEILHPGLALERDDSGLGSLGRIDDADIAPGTVVGMHPHRDDEILTYLRSGEVEHRDTVGRFERISPRRLMLMNAGAVFQHEEHVLPEGGPLRALQIFARPSVAGLDPMVQFHDFGRVYADDGWRLVAGPGLDAPLRFRSANWVHDLRLASSVRVPELPMVSPNVTRLLYVFAGRVTAIDPPRVDLDVQRGEAILLKSTTTIITAAETTDLVLFTTDESAPCFKGGMFSGDISSKRR